MDRRRLRCVEGMLTLLKHPNSILRMSACGRAWGAQALGEAELEGVEVTVEAGAEPPERAAGDGCGCLLVAATSTGCLLGASGVGAPRRPCLCPARPAAPDSARGLSARTRRRRMRTAKAARCGARAAACSFTVTRARRH